MSKYSDNIDAYLSAAYILPIAYKSATLAPADSTNAVFLGEKKFFIVDPATIYPSEQQRFDQEILRRLSLGHQFTAILLTHHHHDHSADAQRIANKFNIPIWAHEKTAALLDYPIAHLLQANEILAAGEDEPLYQAIYTPGHAPGHLCFFEAKSRILVAGDMVAAEGTVLIEPKLGDLHDYLASLQKLLDLSVSIVIAAHGPPIVKGAQKIAFTLAHRHLRLRQLSDILQNDPNAGQNIDNLVSKIYGERLDDLTKKLAALSLRSCLDYLAKESAKLAI